MKMTLSTDVFFGNDTDAWKLVSSCFVVVLLLAPAPEPKTRSNTTNDRDLIIVLFHDIILSCSSLTGHRIQSTSPNKWQIRSVQQSFGKLGNIEDNDEERDNTPEEIHEAIYVKTINGKTISTRYYKNMTAAVILEEVERRTLVPRDMIRLVHKGKMIKWKEIDEYRSERNDRNVFEIVGRDGSKRTNGHRRNGRRQREKRKLDEGKEGKMTKPNEDMAHLKRDTMEALRKSDEKMDSYSRKTDEKVESYSKKDRRKNECLLEKG